ncbi:endopeptidase DegP [Iodidimonas muriae]|uniref:Endopeptidase DegP n=1 Tax=Iodidimonas muriae TaxID=261467 RepID=A0ABQ2L985_9PROT|nr:serine protease [Iodidimonas muriae]GER05924.1 endopeptidase DegP [Kordiimonadales bacterium JCM 17843]GGO07454.1 endopeptidase DegP [Iodidimonas muriae]
MLRRFELLGYALVVILIVVWQIEDREPQERRPRPAPGYEAPTPPPSSLRGTIITINAARKTGNSVGTAYAISRQGLWLTAAHVARDCERMALLTGPDKGIGVQNFWVHPHYDLAVLQTRPFGKISLQGADTLPARGDLGFHMGFPGGKPGDVMSRKMSGGQMRTRGYVQRLEPVDIWAERARIPDSLATLGGISGGPVFNAQGQVVGSTVASTVRRGRIYTTPIASLLDMLDYAGKRWGNQGQPASTKGLTERDFVATGNRLRKNRAVMQVYCQVT